MTTCAAAIKKFEERTGETASDSKIVKLYCQIPPINKLDSSLNNLTNCERGAGAAEAAAARARARRNGAGGSGSAPRARPPPPLDSREV